MPVVSYPAPVGGWNARDDLANMPPEDAVKLVNWRPRPGYLETRGGVSDQLIPTTSSRIVVGTVETYRSTYGDILVYTEGDDIYVWDGDAASSTKVYTGAVTGKSALYWDSAHFQDRFIMTLGDGLNKAQVVGYFGSGVYTSTDLNITAGPDPEDIRGVQVHKGRAYYWETASQSFWYAAAGAYQGNLTEFDLGTALKSGSALQMMVTLTVDGGGGQDDLACFIFGSGEVLVYQGDDPGDAAAWELVGAFEIGQPVDPQAHEKIAGTELIYTRDGVIDLAAALQLGRFGENAEFTAKITKAATEAAREHVENEGWQIVHAPGDNCLILNIPTGDGAYTQYIRETDSGGWWECDGWNARFTVFKDKLHILIDAGGVTTIRQALTGSGDLAGNPISTTAIPAFNTMRKPAQRKRLSVVKPFTNYGTPASLKVTGRADFDTTVPSEPTLASGSTAARTQPNKTVAANGHFVSYVLQTKESGQRIQWNSTTLFYELGGPV